MAIARPYFSRRGDSLSTWSLTPNKFMEREEKESGYEEFENTFNVTVEYITHMPSVLGRLCKCANKYCSFLDCQANECLMRLKGMVKLYMKVRKFHALKKSNTQNVETKGLKRNRKMLKLSHL